jgi:hypothetical protein
MEVLKIFSILKTCENCDTIKGHDNEPNPRVPSPLRSSRAQFSELVSMHLCDTTIWGAHPSQPRDIRQPPVNFAGVSAWLYTPVSSWTLWSKLVYQVQDSFFADKTCTNLVHKFVMHHVNYESIPLVPLWNISYFDCGWFKLAKGAKPLCHDAIILGSFGHPKVISFRYNCPTGHSRISSFGFIFLWREGDSILPIFPSAKREKTICCKKPARQTMGTNLSL